MPTNAAEYLADLQNRHPIWSGAGRVEQLFAKMQPDLPESIQAMHRSGELAVGGTSSPGVLVETRPVKGEFVIEMTSTFMQFFYAVIRTMCGNASVTNNQGKVVQAALTVEQLVEHLTKIVNVWKSGALWDGRKYSYPQFPMDPEQIEIAEKLTQHAELFVLAHEIGHVLAACAPDECIFPPGLPKEQGEELWADAFATLVMLRIGNRFSPRDAYAGSLYAVRLCAWLERMGFSFGPAYPPAEKRFEQVRNMARFTLSDDHFEFISTIGQALDDQLQSFEERVLGARIVKKEGADPVIVRLRSVAEEIARGRVPRDSAITTIRLMVKDVPEPTLLKVADRLHTGYVSLVPRDGAPGDDIRVKIGKELVAIVDDLHEPARAIFRRTFKLD